MDPSLAQAREGVSPLQRRWAALGHLSAAMAGVLWMVSLWLWRRPAPYLRHHGGQSLMLAALAWAVTGVHFGLAWAIVGVDRLHARVVESVGSEVGPPWLHQAIDWLAFINWAAMAAELAFVFGLGVWMARRAFRGEWATYFFAQTATRGH